MKTVLVKFWLIFKHNEELKLRKSRFFDPENQHVQIASIIMNPKYYVTLRNTEVIRFSIARFSVTTDYFLFKIVKNVVDPFLTLLMAP